MGLLDNLYFGQNANFGGQGGGLLDFLRTTQMQNEQYQPSAGFGSDGQLQASPIAIGNDYQMPRVGSMSQFTPDPAAIPQNAQPTQGQLPQQPMQAPQTGLPPALGGQSPGAGIGDRLGAGFNSFIGNAHTGPIGALLGGLSGLVTGQRNDAQGVAQQNLKAQYNAYIAAGLPPQKALLATLNPKAAEALLPQIAPSFKAHNVGNTAGAFNEATGEFKPSYTEPKYEKLGPGDNLVAVGGSGGAARTVASGGPEKPPSGYDWVDPKDPSKGVQAIPGGPATHLPSETAGRIAMMETGAADLPNARKVLMDGRGSMGTGVSGAAASAANIGETGRANRTVRVAIEGALRAMTGAVAPETEVKRYENMFLPSPFDSRETAAQKLNKLDDFISNAKRLVTQGRGPAGNQPAGRASDPLGIR